MPRDGRLAMMMKYVVFCHSCAYKDISNALCMSTATVDCVTGWHFVLDPEWNNLALGFEVDGNEL